MSELLARHRAVIPNWVGIYYDEPIEIVSGKGCRVTDAQGRGYLDFFAGILTNMLGYDVPEVRDAVERQIASGVVHTSTLYLIRNQVELAEKIAKLSGIKDAKVFFTNSGTEANEPALLAALTARKAKEVLDEHGILLISDEVQTGWGRTGEHFWGISAHGITPDAMTFAKGLGNGFAIGGVVARGDLLDGIRGNGISTFGGNPLATAAGNATLDYVLSHDLQHNAAVTGNLIISGLREATQHLGIVSEVRGKGLMFAVDLVDPVTKKPSPPLAGRMLEATKERGLLIGKGGLYGHTLRMAPPLTLTEAEAKEGLGILTDALTAVNEEAAK